MEELLLIAVGAALVNNVVLSQFLGLCPFLGVSKKVETAAGMGGAVIFVLTISSFITSLIYKFILANDAILNGRLVYLQTIVFILVIAALVQFVEENDASALQRAWGVLAIDYDKLCGTWSCFEKRAEGLWNFSQCCEWVCNGGRIYDRHCHHGRNSGEDRT